MTVQPTRDALPPVAVARASCRYYIQHGAGYEPTTWEVASILDALDHADLVEEQLLTRNRNLLDAAKSAEAELDSWMTRAYEAEQRAWRAEARIKAVRDVLDRWDLNPYVDRPLRYTAEIIRRALDN